MKRLTAALCGAFAMLALAAAAPAATIIGANEDQPKFDEDGGAALYSSFVDVGLKENVLTVLWDGTDTIKDQGRISAAISNAKLRGISVSIALYPAKAKLVADTPDAAAKFAAFAVKVAQTFPDIRKLIAGNEPNQPRFMQPQFASADANAANVSAAAYEGLLAATYDAVKAAAPGILIGGVGLSPRGNDMPAAKDNISTSPVRFLKYLGDAYRASGRTAPLFDVFSLHPYPNLNTDSPDVGYKWPNSGVPNLARMKQALWDAFNGTGQKTVEDGLHLELDEVGWQVNTEGKAGYSGKENVPTVDEAAQAAYYAKVIDVAVCDPAVESLNFFHFVDEADRDRFQSGVIDVTRGHRASYDSVKGEIAATGGGCSGTPVLWAHATGVLGAKAIYQPAGSVYKANENYWTLRATAEEEARYVAGIFPFGASNDDMAAALAAKATASVRAATPVLTAIGTVKANFTPLIRFPVQKLPVGKYVYAIRLAAWANPSRTAVFVTPAFQVGSLAPVITLLKPNSGSPGTVVTIGGSGFVLVKRVRFGTMAPSAFTVLSPRLIRATVRGPITRTQLVRVTVQSAGGIGAAKIKFRVRPARPLITRLTPVSGPPGTRVTITGRNFYEVTSVRFFRNKRASFRVMSPTRIVATVPRGATRGRISVTTGKGYWAANSAQVFAAR